MVFSIRKGAAADGGGHQTCRSFGLSYHFELEMQMRLEQRLVESTLTTQNIIGERISVMQRLELA